MPEDNGNPHNPASAAYVPEEPVCGKCGREMSPKDSKLRPELFLHDACLPQECRPPKPSAPGFDPEKWARKFRAVSDESGRNSMMDSGWSEKVANRTRLELLILHTELFGQLKYVLPKPEDFFDRPTLAAVLAAVGAAVQGRTNVE